MGPVSHSYSIYTKGTEVHQWLFRGKGGDPAVVENADPKESGEMRKPLARAVVESQREENH